MSDTNYDDEHMVTRSCVWCSEEMPMDADMSASIGMSSLHHTQLLVTILSSS